MNEELPDTGAPRVEAVIAACMARHRGVGKAAQAAFFEDVHQDLAPLARELERELAKATAHRVTDIKAPLAEVGTPDAKALLQRWYDLYGGSKLTIRDKYPEDKYAQAEMDELDRDTEKALGIASQYMNSLP